MPRGIRPRRLPRVDLEAAARRWIETGEPAAMGWLTWKDSAGNFIGDAYEVWQAYGDAIIADHARDHPGERPVGFWRLSRGLPLRRAGEAVPSYLTRTNLWLPGEREAFDASRSRREREAEEREREQEASRVSKKRR